MATVEHHLNLEAVDEMRRRWFWHPWMLEKLAFGFIRDQVTAREFAQRANFYRVRREQKPSSSPQERSTT